MERDISEGAVGDAAATATHDPCEGQLHEIGPWRKTYGRYQCRVVRGIRTVPTKAGNAA